MARTAHLSIVLRHVTEADAPGAAEYCAREHAATGDPYLLGLGAFASFLGQQFEAAAGLAASALDASTGDDEALMLARATAGVAAAAWPSSAPDPARADTIAEALLDIHLLDSLDPDSAAFTRYLLAEAALACARLDLAEEIISRSGDLPTAFLAVDGRAHPFLAVIQAMRMRALGFRGRVGDALDLADHPLPAESTALTALLLDSTRCFLLGNAAQRSTLNELADRLDNDLPVPDQYISSGCYLLVAYGFIAVGNPARAVGFLLRAGQSQDLDALCIIDRALGLELLVASAVAEEDLDAAEAWRDVASPLLAHPIARPTIERIHSRVEFLAGNVAESAAWARFAIEHAELEGRTVEAAEGEIVLSRANIALAQSGVAGVRLESMVAEALERGHFAARRSAATELRSAGRRLRPIAGAGWAALSPREREVAVFIAEGLGNQAIAGRLHLSQHTVRAHVSRVLAAFGVASRFAVAAQLADLIPSLEPRAALAALTPRQEGVVDRVVLGRSNDEIAHDLGISIKTVEKHVSEILRRWELSSRIGIARAALSRSLGSSPAATGDPDRRTAS